MTHEKKIEYMEIASKIVGFGFQEKDLDLLVSVYDLVVEKQGKTDLKMVLDVKKEVKARADLKAHDDLPNFEHDEPKN